MTLESDIFAHCMPSGQQVAKTEPSPEDKETQPQKRQKPEQNFRFQAGGDRTDRARISPSLRSPWIRRCAGSASFS